MKIQLDATVRSPNYFTAKSVYMFRVSQHPSSGVLKTVNAASGTGHNIGTATSLHRGQVGSPDLATLQYNKSDCLLLHLVGFLFNISMMRRLRWSSGSMLAFSTQVRGFKLGRSRRILGRKNPQHPFLRRGSKAVGPMS